MDFYYFVFKEFQEQFGSNSIPLMDDLFAFKKVIIGSAVASNLLSNYK